MSLKDLPNISFQNVVYLVTFVFYCGIQYSKQLHTDEQLNVLEERLEKKIKVIAENQKEIIDLKVELAKCHNK